MSTKAWIFRENNYKNVLRRLLEEDEQPRGAITRLAAELACHRSYLSQVMSSHVQLTKDQSWGVCEFFELSDLEASFFMTLVELERSASRLYRQHLQGELKRMIREHQDLSKNFSSPPASHDELARYYLSWLPSAVHILTSIRRFQKLPTIAQRFNVPLAQVEFVALALEKEGLVRRRGESWEFAGTTKFIPKTSPYAVFHHQNWRQRANLDAMKGEGVHFTAVQSVSEKDLETLREMMIDFIRRVEKVAAPSAPEALVSFCLDFYEP